MELLELIDLELKDFIFFCGVILLASFVRGFSGFGFFLAKHIDQEHLRMGILL